MIETKFKKSEVGLIPEDWEVKRLGDLCKVNGRIGFRGYTKADLVSPGMGAFTIGGKHITHNILDLSEPDFISWEKYYESPEIMVHKGDIVMAQRGTLGRAAHIEEEIGPATINPSLVLLNKIKCNDKFMHFILSSERCSEAVINNGSQTSVPMISQAQIERIELQMPPTITEQSLIAEALSDVDDLIATTKNLIEKKRNIKEGAMQDLLSGKRRLPGFTGKWVETSIGKLCKPYKGSQINKNDLEVSQSGYPVMNGGVSPSGFHYDYNESANTIIMSEGGNSCGYVSYMKTAFWAGGHCYVLRPTEPISLDYLYQLLKYNEPAIMDLRTGSGLPNIKKSSLNGFTLTISQNKEEQQAIAQVLSDMDSEIQSLEVRLTKYQSLKQGMMQQLLTGKIRLI